MTADRPAKHPFAAALVASSVLAGVLATAPAPVLAGQGTASRPVTFSKDIAPILQRSCQGCHRPGAMAPMSLVTYEDVRPWARAIKQKTALREMPPWFIEKNVGIQRFKDDPSLSDDEIAALGRWADTGAQRGDPAHLPPPRTFPRGTDWSIGTPDLVVSSPVTIVKAVAADQNIQLEATPTGLADERYVKAVEVRETRLQETTLERVAGRSAGDLNYFVLHHAVINVERLRPRDSDSGPGGRPVDASAGRGERMSALSLVHEVSQNATIFPDDVGVTLPADSAITWDVHFHSIGKDVPVRVDVAFKFHPKGYRPKYKQPVRTVSMTLASQSDLDIPAGQTVMVDGYFVTPQPSKMLSFEPHLHSSGKRMCAEAIYPNGYREILNCAGYNHNWVKIYNYEDEAAPLLPAGTIIHMIAWYDNTSANPRVVDPRNWKGFGSRSIDDMSLMLPRMLYLTADEFKEEVAVRRGKKLLGGGFAQTQNE